MDPARPPASPARPTRRHLLRRAALAGAAGALGVGLYAWQVEPFWWHALHVDLPIAGLPPALAGRRLVQVSDLHIGPIVDEDYLARVLADLEGLDPDLLVITGDVVHYTQPRDVDQAARVLSRLPKVPLGSVAILGNHDYGRAWSEDRAADRVARTLTDLGVRVLRNDVVEVAGLQVAGLDDLWAGRLRPHETLGRLDPAKASLVLCHNPDGLDEPGWEGYRGWVLSGHTHGGQVKPPFLSPPLLPVRNTRYTRGDIDLGDGRRVYINAGLGYLRQVRLNVRPEVTVFHLLRA